MPPRHVIEGVRYRPSSERNFHVASGDWIDCTAGEMLRRAALREPDKVAVVGHDRDLRFRELDDASECVAAGLIGIGLRPGDRAVFQLGTVTEFFVAFYACFKAGIVPVATLPQFREIEMEALATRAGAKAYFVQADVAPGFDQLGFARRLRDRVPSLAHMIVVRGAAGDGEHAMLELQRARGAAQAREIVRPHDPDPEDVAIFQMSGGSTGLPKIIPRFHAEYLGSAAAICRRWELTSDDKAMWTLPLIHNAGVLIAVLPMAIDCRTTIVLPRFDAREFLETAARRRVTFSGSIGPVAPRLLEFENPRQFDLSALRQLFTLSRSDAVEAHLQLATHNMFGITEGLLMGSAPSDTPTARYETVGWPASRADDVKLFEPGAERVVAAGEVGELCFRGPHTLTGYFGDDAATAASFTRDGYFRTGDLAIARHLNGRTYYSFAGRFKDNINRGGEKIGAEEVEVLVAAHPAVADVRVVAMPDKHYGEKVCAYIILRPGHTLPTLAELGAFLGEKGLAKYKTPERIEAIDAFPVTQVGKVDKVRMRQMIADKIAAEAGVSNGKAPG